MTQGNGTAREQQFARQIKLIAILSNRADSLLLIKTGAYWKLPTKFLSEQEISNPDDREDSLLYSDSPSLFVGPFEPIGEFHLPYYRPSPVMTTIYAARISRIAIDQVRKSDTTGEAGGLMNGVASKAIFFCSARVVKV